MWIERRYKFSRTWDRTLIARMVEWVEGVDGEGQVPVYGSCLLSPNRIVDVELAKRLVHRYLDRVVDEIEFVVNME